MSQITYKGLPVKDDTAYLSAMIASSSPIPTGEYTISDTLTVKSHGHVCLSPGAIIRLADGASCVMLKNESCDTDWEPDEGFSIEGGTWDGNNAYQQRGLPDNGKPYNMGLIMRLDNCRNVTLKGLTYKDPEAYAVQFRRVTGFTVRDITFDYNMLRPNMDGIHVNGPASVGFVQNVQGATNDDLVALNCNDLYDDGKKGIISSGDISNVVIDGIFAEGGYTAVRLLSCGNPLQNVTIRNIFGTYRCNGVSFTHHNIIPGAESRIENILVENFYAAKFPENPPRNPLMLSSMDGIYGKGCYEDAQLHLPLLWLRSGVKMKNITLRNIHREEYSITQAPTIGIEEGAYVNHLILEDITGEYHSTAFIPSLDNKGEVNGLYIRDPFE